MKKITLEEFKTFVSRDDWKRSQEHEIIEKMERYTEDWDYENDTFKRNDIPCAYGWAAKTSNLDGIKITYTESFNYDCNDPDSLDTGTEGQDTVWEVEGVSVIDDYDEELTPSQLGDYLSSEFTDIDYSILQILKTIDIDTDEDSDMEKFTISIDNQPDVRFNGVLIASISSSDDNAAGSNYSGQTGRWTELYLYKTISGKYVCHQIGRTIWQGEKDRFSGTVCETLEDVKNFFGHKWLAKELYAEAEIEDVIDID